MTTTDWGCTTFPLDLSNLLPSAVRGQCNGRVTGWGADTHCTEERRQRWTTSVGCAPLPRTVTWTDDVGPRRPPSLEAVTAGGSPLQQARALVPTAQQRSLRGGAVSPPLLLGSGTRAGRRASQRVSGRKRAELHTTASTASGSRDRTWESCAAPVEALSRARVQSETRKILWKKKDFPYSRKQAHVEKTNKLQSSTDENF